MRLEQLTYAPPLYAHKDQADWKVGKALRGGPQKAPEGVAYEEAFPCCRFRKLTSRLICSI